MLKLKFQLKYKPEAGIDEAGRGCYAGPVVAAAVILPPRFKNHIINDSKQLKEADRDTLRLLIEKEALAYNVAFIDNHIIDKVNILKATFMAMHKAIEGLKITPGYLLIDGNRFPNYQSIPHTCIIKGDEQYMNIAAASILAKTYRDEYIKNLHKKHPEYDWENNKGYGTLSHRNAIEKFGITKYHRKSFNIIKTQQLNLFDKS